MGKPCLANSKVIRVAAVVFGSIYAAGGIVALLSMLDVIPRKLPLALPYLVLGMTASVIFIAAGLGTVLFGLGKKMVAARLGLLALLCFMMAFNWIAFGPGERNFSRKMVSGFSAQTAFHVSALEGRIVFGIAALMMDGVVVYGFMAWKRHKTY